MNFIKRAFGELNKFQMKWLRVWIYLDTWWSLNGYYLPKNENSFDEFYCREHCHGVTYSQNIMV